MQKKFINSAKLKEYLSLGRDVVFLDASPTEDITFPVKKVVAAAFHLDKIPNSRSSLYVMRYGRDENDTSLLNVDLYTFSMLSNSDEGKVSITGPSDTFRRSDDHHINDIPSVLREGAEQKYLYRLEEIKQGNLSDSNFL